MTPRPSSANLLASLDLQSDGDSSFVGKHQVIPSGRAYGGEVVAQAVAAAMNTVAGDRSIHSFHGYFLRPGDVHTDTHWAVDRVRDGRGFSARAVTGSQNGKAIFSGQASFHVATVGVEHHESMPADLPSPESLPTAAELLLNSQVRDAHYWAHERNFDIRHSPAPVYVSSEGERTRRQVVWLRAYDRLPDDPNIHRAALAYLCDYTLLEPVLRNNGVSWSDDGLMTASLDHAMWWHSDGRVDDWIALVQDSPAAHGGRGLAMGRIYSRDGTLMASVAQEGLVRLPVHSAVQG